MALQVAFLWHMHQPYYVDPLRGTALMPWVRLHATKGYLDMIWLVSQFPELHCTFNLTPVLVCQIEQLVRQEVSDLWCELARVPAADLTPAQQCSLLEHYFKANREHMIQPYPRYRSLLQRRGLSAQREQLMQRLQLFDPQDFRDLQMWFHLTWFGYAAERLYPQIVAWKQKGRDFTEEDKSQLLEIQGQVLRECLGRYRNAAEQGQIELSTTPYYHPILPLVYNTEFARRCLPRHPLPTPFAHAEDVRAQLERARDSHTATFGQPPRGLWPAEGSVCPELIPILQELGFEWFATDEAILWRSLGAAGTDHPGASSPSLFRGFRVQAQGAAISAVFRERSLSDFIGFNAARNRPADAAAFVTSRLEEIARATAGRDDGLCAIVLDGENAWEQFPDGGEQFLRGLYQRLVGSSRWSTTTFHDKFARHPATAPITNLHTGSWINADFDIWIGDREENRAWELLGQTRDFLQSRWDRREIAEGPYRQALEEIFAAEGSDWFWWYGEDFVTDNDLIFDELFRSHLQNVYRLAGAPVPEALRTPICRSEVVPELSPPTGLITPKIDGLLTSYYEWTGAGFYGAGRALTTMYRSERIVQAIYFGFDLAHWYLRLDFRPQSALPGTAQLEVICGQPTGKVLTVGPLQPGPVLVALAEARESAPAAVPCAEVAAHLDRLLEVRVPLACLGYRPGERVEFRLRLSDGGLELERHPELGTLSLEVPDESFEIAHWHV